VAAAHGLGGLSGALLTGVFAAAAWGGVDGLLAGDLRQAGVQLVAVLAVMAFSGAASFGLLKLVSMLVPLRVGSREEGTGLDVPMHGEEAYTHGEGALLLLPSTGVTQERPVLATNTALEVSA
jgi:Amt family ammonium transporter